MKHESPKEKIKRVAKTVFQFIVNPRLLFCFALAWLITNGWSYILLGLGAYHEIEWMMAVSGAYLAFIWLPFTPEKILTLAISIGLLHIIFPHDKKTLGLLKELLAKQKKKKETPSEDAEDAEKANKKDP